MIKIGNSDITSIKVGTSGCSAYLGDVKLYPTESKNYFCTEALGSGSITFTMPSILQTSSYSYVEYSTDSGTTWSRVSNTSTTTAATVSVSQGDKVYWRGSGIRTCEGNATNVNYIARFSATTNYNVEGNAMSLLFGDDHVNAEFDSGTTYHMAGLFSGDTHVINASGLTLLATTLYDNDYNNMFKGCSNLASFPQLAQASFSTTPTTGGGCYKRMFADCTSITVIPSGITIGSSSSVVPRQLCEGMFSGCTSLTAVPSGLLPATTLEDEQNYRYMFQRCSGLTAVPSDLLPATTLADSCYNSMFLNCTSLTTAPELPATTLADNCYRQMFQKTSLTVAPTLPATTLAEACYQSMFDGCSGLSAITCLATDITASACTTNWVYKVSSTGTFTKAASMTSWTRGTSGIPNGWTVVDYSG